MSEMEKYIESADVEKKVVEENVKLFGRQINMGDITPEEYNKLVSRLGNKFLVPEAKAVKCLCGKFHRYTRKGLFKLTCPDFNIEIKAGCKPKLYEKWIKSQIELIKLVEETSKKIKSEDENNK